MATVRLALSQRELMEASGHLRSLLKSNLPDVEGLVLEGRWLKADGSHASDPITLGTSRKMPIEGFDGAGGIGWHDDLLEVCVDTDPPSAAETLEVRIQGQIVGRLSTLSLFRTSPGLPAPQRDGIGPADAAFVVQIVAERFSDFDAFREYARNAHSWALSRTPFDEEGLREQLRFELLFWPSDLDVGNFNTPDTAVIDNRLFYGNRVLASEQLSPHLNPRFPSIIFINSERRGGAGGSGRYSAWTSVGSDDWRAVCLHELGHSLGLADEYVDEKRQHLEWEGEPNVSAEPCAGLAPWRSMITVSQQSCPSHDKDHQGSASAGEIGTFQGARYRKDYYRPMRSCIMRSTLGDPTFCQVCAEVVRRSVGKA